MKYQYIFGPVASRRLGISLGVDLVPHKTCTMDCIYCECGKTTNLTLDQKEYVPLTDVIKELDHFFLHHADPDYITFSGSGEPTLNLCLDKVIDHIRSKRPGIRIAVLTNSSLLMNSSVTEALLKADLVLPSLDAVSKLSFLKINRPHSALDPEQIVVAIESFVKRFQGRVWLEVLILPGINDAPDDLTALREAIRRINPDRLQINTLDRPGTLPGIRPATRPELEKAGRIFDFPRTDIIARSALRDIRVEIPRQDFKNAVLTTIHRRPCTKEDLMTSLGVDEALLDNCLQVLMDEKIICGIQETAGLFFQTVKPSS